MTTSIGQIYHDVQDLIEACTETGQVLPDYVEDILSVLPLSAIQSITSKDFDKGFSVICYADKESEILDALKDHEAGIKIKGNNGQRTEGVRCTTKYGDSRTCIELKSSDDYALPPIRLSKRLVCIKDDLHPHHNPLTSRRTHILKGSHCKFECVLRYFQGNTKYFL